MRAPNPVLVSAMVAGVVAVLWLDHYPLWDAEAWTRRVALMPWDGMLAEVRSDRHPPLYFALEWALVRIADRDALLRLPSAIALIATAAVTSWTALRWRDDGPGNGGAALVAGLFVATSPFTAAYAGTARSAMLTALVGASAFALCGLSRRWAPVLLSVVIALGAWLHYSAAAVVVAVTLAGILGRQWRVVAAALVGAATLTPWLLGPTEAQVATMGATSRNLSVFHFLLWPVGGWWFARGATVLAVMAGAGGLMALVRPGRRGQTLGWIVALLAVPWAMSGLPGMVMKTYVFAPFLPLFGVMLGVAIPRHWLATAGALAVIAAVHVPGLLHLWSLPANLASISPRSVGIHDTRREAALLLQLARVTGHTVQPMGRSPQDWYRYEPLLAPNAPYRPEWRVSERNQVQQRGWCPLEYGFEAIIDFRGDCDLAGQVLVSVSEGYGPFELEAAAAARARGEPALQLAEAAAEHLPASGMAELAMGGWLIEDGRPADAAVVLEQGARKSAMHGRTQEWREIETLRDVAMRQAGDMAGAREAKERLRCLQEHSGPWEARSCI
jgi:hypothetical protein